MIHGRYSGTIPHLWGSHTALPKTFLFLNRLQSMEHLHRIFANQEFPRGTKKIILQEKAPVAMTFTSEIWCAGNVCLLHFKCCWQRLFHITYYAFLFPKSFKCFGWLSACGMFIYWISKVGHFLSERRYCSRYWYWFSAQCLHYHVAKYNRSSWNWPTN